MTKKPLAIDLFCGLGGWTEGLLTTGWRVIGFDLERHVYGEHEYPAQLIVQDVLTLHGSQFRDADLIVASPPCFVADTLILTARGMVPIPEVIVGDLVLTHRLRWRPVLRAGSTVAPTLTASGYGGTLEGTAEHPIYARHDAGSRQQWDKAAQAPAYQPKRLQPPTWVPLSETEGVHWGAPAAFESLPVPEIPNGLPDTPAFWWIVGRWVGDGWVRLREGQGDEVIICCAEREADELGGRLDALAPRSGNRAGMGEIHWRRSKERTTARFTAASNSLARWLTANFGRGAAGKSWPAWVLGMDAERRQAMLDGYASADGYEGNNGPSRVTKVTTVSKALALSTRLLAASLGATANMSFFRRPKTAVIEDRTVQQRDTWQVSWTPDDGDNRLVERAHGHLWGKVRKVVPSQKMARVWNLEVADDNSYVADGITVHNCQEYSYMAMPWSRAKQIARALKGEDEFPQGYTGSRTVGELNRLFDACFRIQREACEAAGQHIPMVVENVRGAQPWVGRAAWNFGSYYLWGDVPALMPVVQKRAPKMNGRSLSKDAPPEAKWGGHNVSPHHGDATKYGHATKNPGFRFDGSGRSFQSESVGRHTPHNGYKSAGLNWSDQSKRGQDFTRVAGQQAIKHGGDWFSDPSSPGRQGGVKQPGIGGQRKNGKGDGWFQDGAAQHGSRSPARKFASAMIAKIPEELARHVARVYRPAQPVDHREALTCATS